MNEQDARLVVRRLFLGSSCHSYMDAAAVHGDYVLVHHRAHKWYVHRSVGSKTCKSYYALVHKDQKRGGWMLSAKTDALLFFRGRMNAARRKEVEERVRRPL